MIKQNIKFVTTGQFVTFYNTCRNLSADITVKDIENHRMNINGKELSELMAIRLGLPVTLIIHGDDEQKADRLLQKYRVSQYCVLLVQKYEGHPKLPWDVPRILSQSRRLPPLSGGE